MCKIILISSFLFYSHLHVFSIEKDADSKNIIGMHLLVNKRPAEAEKYFRDAISENTRVKYYYNNLAVSLMQQKKYIEAIDELNKAVKIDPAYVKAVSNLAVCYYYLSDYRTAYLYYRKAEKINADYVKNRFTREKIKEKTGELENKGYDEKEINEFIDSVTEK